MIDHDTAATIAAIERHLGSLFKVETRVFSAGDHDGRDGEPVAYVEVGGEFDIYPIAGTRQSIAGTVEVTRWAIDRLVDDSDPSVGMYGSAPEVHSDHDTFDLALIELAKLIAETHVERSLEAEGEEMLARAEDYDEGLCEPCGGEK